MCGWEFPLSPPSTSKELQESPVDSTSGAKQPFFRSKPAVVTVGIVGSVYALFALLDILLLYPVSRGALHGANYGDEEFVLRMLVRGALTNVVVAALCFVGWSKLRQRTANSLKACAFNLSVVLLITGGRLLYWQLKGANPAGWLEPVFIWPLLVYAIVYAHRESRLLQIG